MLEKIALLTMPGIALLIVTADWIVAIVLGPQWSEVASLLIILGIGGLIQPISNTTGWLFVTQGRTNEMFRVAMVGGPITIASIVAGLPWGAKGVAISYVTVHLLMTHFVYWYATRRGPVRILDLYKIILTFGLPSGFGILASLAFRYWQQPTNPLIGVLASALITGATVVLVLLILPSGRHALRDVLHTATLLWKRPAQVP
jgi:O-antigen/teichoic acid export membrane protein